MGRELRKVPANWEHPKNKDGHHIPLHGDSFIKTLDKWQEESDQWNKGFRKGWGDQIKWVAKEGDQLTMTFEQWDGKKPVKEDYMPEWEEKELTHIQLYETTSEGTPISPVFPASEFEQLCEWAAENETTFANFKTSKEEWMRMLSDNFVYHQSGNTTFI